MPPPCPICRSSNTLFLDWTGVHADYCRDCGHFSSCFSLTEDDLTQYYATKEQTKWSRRLADFQRDGTVLAISPLHITRTALISDFLRQHNFPHNSLLDVGCLDGQFLQSVEDLIPRRLGIDFSSGGIEYGQAARHQPVHIAALDSELVRSQGPFDTITCFHVIEHVLDPADFLLDVKKHLHPDGVFFLACPVVTARAYRIPITAEFGKKRDATSISLYTEHVHQFSPSSIAALCNQTGFKILFEHRFDYKGPDWLEEGLFALQIDPKPSNVVSSGWMKDLALFLSWRIATLMRIDKPIRLCHRLLARLRPKTRPIL